MRKYDLVHMPGLLLAAGLLVGVPAAAAHVPPYGAPSPAPVARQELLYVDLAVVPARASARGALTIRVEGSLPDPAWQLVRLDVRRQGRTITVRPLGTRDPAAIAIQVLKPYAASTDVRGLSPGRYEVVIQGRGNKSIKRTVQVDNRK